MQCNAVQYMDIDQRPLALFSFKSKYMWLWLAVDLHQSGLGRDSRKTGFALQRLLPALCQSSPATSPLVPWQSWRHHRQQLAAQPDSSWWPHTLHYSVLTQYNRQTLTTYALWTLPWLPDWPVTIRIFDITALTMVRKSVKKETGKLYEEKKMMRHMMMDGVVQESNPNRVDVNKADTRGMTPLHAAGIR